MKIYQRQASTDDAAWEPAGIEGPLPHPNPLPDEEPSTRYYGYVGGDNRGYRIAIEVTAQDALNILQALLIKRSTTP